MKKKWCGICKDWAFHEAKGCPKREPLPVRSESDCWVCLVCGGKGKVMTLKPRSKKGWNPCVRCVGSGNATGKWARKPNVSE